MLRLPAIPACHGARLLPLALIPLAMLALPAWSQPASVPVVPVPAEAAAATVASATSDATAPAAAPAIAAAAAAPAADDSAVIAETILVTGQRPGPGLWKVSRGDHVLWIFGTYAPLPRQLQWRSQQVETILAQSQEYLLPPAASADVGFLSQMAMLPFALGYKKNPDGAYLKDVLPAPVHARWLALKQKYLGNDDSVERERPIFAAETLYNKALEQAGLAGGPEVRKTLDGLVKKSGIKRTSTTVALQVDDPVTMMREFKRTPLEDVTCFANTLDKLEHDVEAMRVRANAWATGDLAVIEQLKFGDDGAACSNAVLSSAVMQNRPGMRDVEARMREHWLAAADRALASNPSTFASLPMRHLLDKDGYLAALTARGYTVEKPE